MDHHKSLQAIRRQMLHDAKHVMMAALVIFMVSSAPLFANYDSIVDRDRTLFVQAIEADMQQALAQKSRHLADKDAVREFYVARHYAPFWIDDKGLKSSAIHLIVALEEAWSHGLNPRHYKTQQIKELARDEALKDDMAIKARLEITLTDAFARYARDLSGMRVNAKALGLDDAHWKQQGDVEEMLAVLPRWIRASEEDQVFAKILDQIEPKSITYRTLRRELKSLVKTNLVSGGYEPKKIDVDLKGVLLKAGWSHRAVPAVRDRLGLPQPTRGAFDYDEELAQAVRSFQIENGLHPDAVIGPRTLDLLNTSNHDRILQIMANMERLRWVDKEKPDRYVVVNIPSSRLWAIDGRKVEVEMPVIVGKPGRETLSFVTEIKGLRVNPDWTIPPTIKRKDIWPKVQEDPSYLVNKGIAVTRKTPEGRFETVNSAQVDWSSLSWGEVNRMRMVQVPGARNPLGRYRVLMPNKHNIYIHDTNKPQYFERSQRALSSGCIRMKEPERMAEFILGRKDRWSHQDTKDTLGTGKTKDILIDQPIPVYLLYYTVWIGEGNTVVYGHDIYDRDRDLIAWLKTHDAIFVPGQNSTKKSSKVASAKD